MTTKWTTEGSVVVCTRSRASSLMCSTRTRGDIGGVVSIACTTIDDCGPRSHLRPFGLSSLTVPKLLFNFDDDSRESPGGPKIEHVQQAISWFESRLSYFRNEEPKKLLIHCYGGYSRSTAMALIGFAMARGAGMESKAVNDLVNAAERGSDIGPNPVIVGLADEALKRDRRLLHAF